MLAYGTSSVRRTHNGDDTGDEGEVCGVSGIRKSKVSATAGLVPGCCRLLDNHIVGAPLPPHAAIRWLQTEAGRFRLGMANNSPLGDVGGWPQDPLGYARVSTVV